MYTIVSQSGDTSAYVLELQCLTRDEINNLPKAPTCAFGSNCLCVEDSSVWVLGSDNVWHEL